MKTSELIAELDVIGAMSIKNLRNLTGDAKAAAALEAIAIHLRALLVIEAGETYAPNLVVTPIGDDDCHCNVCVNIKREAQMEAQRNDDRKESKRRRDDGSEWDE